jgi:hypothetical protein
MELRVQTLQHLLYLINMLCLMIASMLTILVKDEGFLPKLRQSGMAAIAAGSAQGGERQIFASTVGTGSAQGTIPTAPV